MRSNNRITKLLIHTDIQLFTLHLIGIYFHLNISLLNIDKLDNRQVINSFCNLKKKQAYYFSDSLRETLKNALLKRYGGK